MARKGRRNPQILSALLLYNDIREEASSPKRKEKRKKKKGRTHGIFMYSQWYNAFKHRPKVIAITWWNEWAAQRIRTADGTYQFTDNYNQEYSRDIEPMKGGHGDLYYQWMKKYISAYRNLETCPVLVESGYETEAKQYAITKYGN